MRTPAFDNQHDDSNEPTLRTSLFTFLTLVGVGLAATVLGTLVYLTTDALLPATPGYVLLIAVGLALIPSLVLLRRRLPVLGYWYYFLPALLFLLVFTVYPIVLTVYLAFTDYSGSRSGQADRTTQTSVVSATGSLLTLQEPASEALRCNDECAGRRVEVQGGGERLKAEIATVSGNELRLRVEPTFEPQLVSIVSDYSFVGFRNFRLILQRASSALIPVFTWNVLFAVGTVVATGAVGILLAVLLSNKALAFRGAYRTLLIIPWAIPGVISIQMWQALVNYQFGAVNRLLGVLGIYPIPWLQDPLWAKMTVLMVNLWLGFPFMMVAALGALATIPDELYEAAKIDGSGPLQALKEITLPLLYVPMLPVLLTGFAFNFNNFNVIYLLTAGGPAQEGRLSTAQSTDILISWAYKTAFSSGGQTAYGLGAAISLIIFLVTIAISAFNFRFTGVFKEAE